MFLLVLLFLMFLMFFLLVLLMFLMFLMFLLFMFLLFLLILSDKCVSDLMTSGMFLAPDQVTVRLMSRSPSAKVTVENPKGSGEKLSPKESVEGAHTVLRGSVRAPKGFSEGKTEGAQPPSF